MTDPAPQPAAPQPAQPLTEAEDKQWASFAHLGGILGILPSLIIYLVFKERGARTRVEAKEGLNWQITVLIIVVVLYILAAILSGVAFAVATSSGSGALLFLPGLVYFLIFAVYVVNLIFSIMGFVKVNGGGAYRYPFAFRFIK